MASQWEELGKLIETIAPNLSSALRGSNEQIAKTAWELISLALEGKASIDDLPSKLCYPDISDKIKSAEASFGGLFLSASPRANLSSQIMNQTGQNSIYFRNVIKLSIVIVVAFFLAFSCVLFLGAGQNPINIENNGPLGLLLGALISAFTTVVQYFFGSSASGNQKDAMLWSSAPPK